MRGSYVEQVKAKYKERNGKYENEKRKEGKKGRKGGNMYKTN